MWLLQIRNYNIAIIIININYMGKNVKMICDRQCFRTHNKWYAGIRARSHSHSACWMWFFSRKVVDRQSHTHSTSAQSAFNYLHLAELYIFWHAYCMRWCACMSMNITISNERSCTCTPSHTASEWEHSKHKAKTDKMRSDWRFCNAVRQTYKMTQSIIKSIHGVHGNGFAYCHCCQP